MSTKKDEKSEHPYGVTLVGRNTEENRKAWPNLKLGSIPVAETICPAPDQCPPYETTFDAPISEKNDNSIITNDNERALETPIHLLIASFRDRLCPRTLHNAFSRAAQPHRIFIRVMDQRQPDSDLMDDAGCWDRYCSDYNTNCREYEAQVRVVPVDARLSKGPTDARSKLSAMIAWDYRHAENNDNENNNDNQLDFHPVHPQDFCLQTDSHMDFSDHYDLGLIQMHHRTQNDYAVLSTYVADIEQNNKHVRSPVPNLCMVRFTSTIRNWGTKECRNLLRPKLTNAMWGAGLSFHRCHAELNVPIDPYLDDVFDGEEGSRGIRLFTHGYDVYTPDVVLVTHDYHTHQSNPVVHTWGKKQKDTKQIPETHWKWLDEAQQFRGNLTTLGTPRVNLLLGIGEPPTDPDLLAEQEWIRSSRYGLGTRRTLEQAVSFTGINLRQRQMDENKCGNLQWVPFDPLPDYGLPQTFRRRPDGGNYEQMPMLPTFGNTNSIATDNNANNANPPITGLVGAILVAGFIAMSVLLQRNSAGKRKNLHKD